MSATNDFNKRINSIIVKNLPGDFTQRQLEELFSQCGKILNSKILPANINNEGRCGFINYANVESCEQAVQYMDTHVVNGSTLRVSHASSRLGNFDRLQNDSRLNEEFTTRTVQSTGVNLDERDYSSPSQINSFRPVNEQSTKFIFNQGNDEMNNKKSLWNSNFEQQKSNSFSSNLPVTDIGDHEPLVLNKTYNVYLSYIETPNVVFAATLDDYVNATLLLTQMNKHEQLTKVKGHSYKTKLVVGQICAALHNQDWYRARVVEIRENRVQVEYIDWGNTNWCDITLEIRPLPNEYFKDPRMCMKCILDGVQAMEKLSDERTRNIHKILPIDTKLEMTIVRVENGLPYVRLNLNKRDLNNEINPSLSPFTTVKSNQIFDFNSQKPVVDLFNTYFVQLTTVDPQSECFHVLLMCDPLVTIMNTLKDWNATKQPFTHPPKANTLVCAQYELDDLWYRAWIESVINKDQQYRIYFVDFGNEEIISVDRLSECPEILRTIPWQSIQIKLANVKLTNEERYILLRNFETERLEMKILQKNQEIYLVDLLSNGKSIVEYILELRKKPPVDIVPKTPPPPVNIVTKTTSLTPVPPVNSLPKAAAAAPPPPPLVEQKNDNVLTEHITALLAEQKRQNHLLQQVLAAINTTNALLTQLVQR